MERKTIGKSKEDYLKAILVVLKEHGACRNADVSGRLGVSKSSTCRYDNTIYIMDLRL